MPRRSIATFDRVRIVTFCQEGLSSWEVSRRLRVNESDVVRTWGGTEIQGIVDDMHRSGRPKVTTAVDDRYLRISARRNPESNATMLNNAFLAARGRRNSTQTVRNRLYDAQFHSRRPWRGPHLTPRHHAAWYDEHKNTLNGLVRIDIEFYSQMRVACVFNQTIVEDLVGGSLVRQTVQQVQHGGGPGVLGWHYVGPTYATGGHGRR